MKVLFMTITRNHNINTVKKLDGMNGYSFIST